MISINIYTINNRRGGDKIFQVLDLNLEVINHLKSLRLIKLRLKFNI